MKTCKGAVHFLADEMSPRRFEPGGSGNQDFLTPPESKNWGQMEIWENKITNCVWVWDRPKFQKRGGNWQKTENRATSAKKWNFFFFTNWERAEPMVTLLLVTWSRRREAKAAFELSEDVQLILRVFTLHNSIDILSTMVGVNAFSLWRAPKH